MLQHEGKKIFSFAALVATNTKNSCQSILSCRGQISIRMASYKAWQPCFYVRSFHDSAMLLLSFLLSSSLFSISPFSFLFFLPSLFSFLFLSFLFYFSSFFPSLNLFSFLLLISFIDFVFSPFSVFFFCYVPFLK